MGSAGERPPVPFGGLVKAVIGYGGLAMCLTLVFLAMRAVMDIGGTCADGGPYVSAASCPEGSTIALLGGIFAGFGFGLLATLGGAAVGGIWSAAPMFAWSGLFGSLGWNFLDYGVFNASPGAGIDLGWALCGVLFWVMAFGPLLGAIPLIRAGRNIRGPAMRPVAGGPVGSSSVVARDGLAAIATDLQAAIGAAVASVGAVPLGQAVPPGEAVSPAGRLPEPEFTEGTQALLDRLERLADMRDRGLLGPADYETAKAAIMAALEGRS